MGTRTVSEASIADLLRHISGRHLEIDTVADLLELRFDDLDTITGLSGKNDYARRRQLSQLAAAGTDATPDEIIESIDTVGWRVLAEDLPNLVLWFAVGDRIRSMNAGLETWSRLKPADVINQLIEAGRSPGYAHHLADTTAQAGRPLNAYGFGKDITAGTYLQLHTAGVSGEEELSRYKSHGLTIDDIADLASRNIPAAAIAAAIHTGLPAHQWADTLTGMPARWFPTQETTTATFRKAVDPTSGILAEPNATWANLRQLVTHGWAADSRHFTPGRAWKGDGIAPISVTGALNVGRAGITFEEAEKWGAAMTVGKRGSNWWDQGQPPIIRTGALRIDERLDEILAMKNAGVKPAWIGEFRNCGARTVDDVLTLAEAGLTGKSAKALRVAHGEQRSQFSPKRFQTVGHAVDAAMATEAEAAGK